MKPRFISPQLCKPGKTPPGEDWLHEVKLDGYRIVSVIDGKSVKLISRNEKDWTAKFGQIAESLKKLPAKQAVLDGELVALDENGISNFQLLQNALDSGQQFLVPLVLFVFDVLSLNGKDLTQTPLLKRKEILKRLFKTWRKPPPNIQLTHYAIGDGPAVFAEACAHGLEGIISKRIDGVHQSKRTPDWIKAKCLQEEEFVICGFTAPGGTRQYFGSLVLGYYDEKKRLIFAGNVGTGFDQKTLKSLYERLAKLEQKKSPFRDRPKIKNARWVKPKLVAQVKFSNWTDEGVLRQPAFLGLRQDKSAGEVGLSHPDKILYPTQNITKQDLVNYYEEVADWMLPYVVDRPLAMVRCPNGVDAKCFYQKHFAESLPKGIYPIKVPVDAEPYVMIKDASGLVGFVQMNVLEIHPWNSKKGSLNKPEQIIFDLDPAPELSWAKVCRCAKQLRKLLKEVGLESFVKTTGGKGLHVVVPLKPVRRWQDTFAFSKAIAEKMAEMEPANYTTTISKAKRLNKIFIDYLRNRQEATAVAPYCVRARPDALVSMPISWQELTRIDPKQFTITNVLKRLKRQKVDPWADFFRSN